MGGLIKVQSLVENRKLIYAIQQQVDKKSKMYEIRFQALHAIRRATYQSHLKR